MARAANSRSNSCGKGWAGTHSARYWIAGALAFSSIASPALAESPTPDLRCGGLCLYVGLGSLDVDIPSYAEFEKALGQPGAQGYSMENLSAAAQNCGVSALGVRTTCDHLRQRTGRFACIALLNAGHFVLISDVSAGAVSIIDPPGTTVVDASAFQHQWDGQALLLSRSPLETEEALVRRLHADYVRGKVMLGGVVIVVASVCVAALWRFRPGRAALLSGALSLMFCGACSSSDTDDVSTARLHILAPRRDLGSTVAADGGGVKVDFQIVNNGGAPLRVLELIQSCSCTRCEVTPSELDPGASGTVSVFVDELGDGEGRVATVTVVSNDPESPRQDVMVTWKAAPLVEFDPPRINFGTVYASDVCERSVVIRRRPGDKIPLDVRTKGKDGCLAAAWDGTPGESALRVSLQPGSTASTTGSIFVTRASREYRIPAVWSLRRPIESVPEAVLLESGGSGDRRVASLQIVTSKSEPLEIAAAEVNAAGDRSNVKLTRVSPSEWRADFEIVLPDADSAGVWRGEAVFTCHSPQEQQLRVPIVAFIDQSE